MNRLLLVCVFPFLISACSQTKKAELQEQTIPIAQQSTSLISDTVLLSNPEDNSLSEENEYQTFHLVTIDEGENYDSLSIVADKVAQQLQVKVDNLGRIYDPKKGIIVPMDDEDEMYRGEYYPRRMAGNSVSIEMKHAFLDSTDENNKSMLLVAGIFEQKTQADSVLTLTKTHFPSAKVVTRQLYMGCMH